MSSRRSTPSTDTARTAGAPFTARESVTSQSTPLRFHHPELVLRLARRVALPAAPKVLDLGCGEGLAALDLARAFPRAKVLGVDPFPVQVARAEQHRSEAGLSNVSFTVADAKGLRRRRFDLIVALQVVQFFREPRADFRRLRALLAPGGSLVMSTIMLPSREPLRSLVKQLGRVFMRSALMLSRPEWWMFLEDSGFQVERSLSIPSRFALATPAGIAALRRRAHVSATALTAALKTTYVVLTAPGGQVKRTAESR